MNIINDNDILDFTFKALPVCIPEKEFQFILSAVANESICVKLSCESLI